MKYLVLARKEYGYMEIPGNLYQKFSAIAVLYSIGCIRNVLYQFGHVIRFVGIVTLV